MLKLSFKREIHADIEKVFDVLSNFENFQKLFPEFYPSILIKSVRDESSLVAEHLKLHDTEFIIMAKHFLTRPNNHEMRVVGGDMKGSMINETLSSNGDTTNLVIYAELSIRASRFSKKNPYADALENLYDAMITEIEKS